MNNIFFFVGCIDNEERLTFNEKKIKKENCIHFSFNLNLKFSFPYSPSF